ncbi:glutamyl-tRNA reductase [Halococcus morrhuae DSM 1307]|uniref:Glutamyl-tRNA reductase n=1 Tax=Halococcus morrhuae DSM 1307 TaxID=931277 RepID=M0M4P1_HALMO|nr:glutamyl-tRNA reductase [Halococcus morrhuae]EMA40368.1 glutamyl-tRNA reductase [Halococcus morrhuae DSM 1307]
MTVATGIISGVSIAHQRASVEQIETACARDERDLVEALLDHEGVREAFSLQTCNRAELYVVADDPDHGRESLSSIVADSPDEVVRELGHEESLRHLMRVACGLESLVLGEDQILGQLQDAYTNARAVGGIGPIFEEGIQKAIHVGERARTETAIDEGVVSLGSAAARLADEERTLADATGLVVGAGEMGTLAAQSLDRSVAQLFVANRTEEKAAHVADQIEADGAALDLDDLPEALSLADVVVSATSSPVPVLDREALATAGETLLIDIAQPRDATQAAAELPNVTHYDLDALESVTEATRERRQEAAERVEAMIDREFDNLLARYKRQRADAVIAAMYENAERMKERELSRALSKLDTDGMTDDQRAVVESLADTLVSQLLAAPTKSLRDAAEVDDWATINSALRLFDPSFDADDTPATLGTNDVPQETQYALASAVREHLDD